MRVSQNIKNMKNEVKYYTIRSCTEAINHKTFFSAGYRLGSILNENRKN